MKTALDALILSNPMRIEIARFRRQFLGVRSVAANRAVLGLVVLCYVGLLMVVVKFGKDIPPLALVMLQTALFCLMGPAMLHGAIAGERERRSWDLLMVAPITKAQIVAGKFMGALSVLGIGAAAMFLPTAITFAAYGKTALGDLLLAESVSLSFCVFVAAGSIYLSARSKRPFMALGAAIGTLVIGLVALPTLIASLFPDNHRLFEYAFYLNPFAALAVRAQEMEQRGLYGSESAISPSLFGLPHTVLYLLFTVALLAGAVRAIRFADDDERALARRRRGA